MAVSLLPFASSARYHWVAYVSASPSPSLQTPVPALNVPPTAAVPVTTGTMALTGARLAAVAKSYSVMVPLAASALPAASITAAPSQVIAKVLPRASAAVGAMVSRLVPQLAIRLEVTAKVSTTVLSVTLRRMKLPPAPACTGSLKASTGWTPVVWLVAPSAGVEAAVSTLGAVVSIRMPVVGPTLPAREGLAALPAASWTVAVPSVRPPMTRPAAVSSPAATV